VVIYLKGLCLLSFYAVLRFDSNFLKTFLLWWIIFVVLFIIRLIGVVEIFSNNIDSFQVLCTNER